MAELHNDLSKEMSALSVNNAHLNKLQLNDNVQSKLNKVKTDYESIFSWNIQKLTGNNQNLMLNLIDRIREKCEIIVDNNDEFNLNRFYLQLITSYELYISESYNESLLEIENTVKLMESCEFDEANEQYSDACNHIARATYAYIAITLNLDSEMIMKDVKPISSLNRAEKAAICGVKARVFMEYPPIGNDIALKFADEACNLHSTEPEWLIIWLKAKGRVRRYYDQFKMPDENEFDVAEILCTTKTKPRLLIQASKLYMEAAFVYKLNFNPEESNKYYKLSSDLTLKAVELSQDNIKQLYSCLMTYIDYPKEFQSKTVSDEIIQKLINVKNSRVDQVLGKYYLKHEKNYEKAKIHLSRGMAAGHFSSALQLVKVECLLQPVEKFALVETLNMIYDVFPSPKRRLIVLSQILIYYYYYENNPKEIMHYLKLYLDQDIDDTFKRRHLIYAYPLFKVSGLFKTKQFLNALSVKVKNIMKYHEWSEEEKKIIDDTCNRFNNISNLRTHENQFARNNQIGFRKQDGDRSNSNREYPNKKPYYDRNNEYNWRKKQVNSSENYSNKNNSHHSSKNIDQNKDNLNNFGPNKEFSVYNNKKTDYVKKSHQTREFMNKLNDSNIVDKFKPQYGSKNNLHVVSVENDSNLRPNTYGLHGKDYNKSNWHNRPDGFQNQNSRSFQHKNNHFNNLQHAEVDKNSDKKTRPKLYQSGFKADSKAQHNRDLPDNSNPNKQNSDTKTPPTHRYDIFHSN